MTDQSRQVRHWHSPQAVAKRQTPEARAADRAKHAKHRKSAAYKLAQERRRLERLRKRLEKALGRAP